MAEYLVTDTDLTEVADVIRSKRGTSAKLTFPEEWKTAINAISSDGSYIPTEPYIEEKYDSNGNLINFTLHGYQSLRAFQFYSQNYLTTPSLPESLTSIGDNAFYNCTNLALTSLPEGITSIGDNAFYNCTNLALTSLPEGITSIGGGAFYNCRNLTSITFKGAPSFIVANVFNNCTNLTNIKVPWAEGAVAGAPWGATNATITYNYTGE